MLTHTGVHVTGHRSFKICYRQCRRIIAWVSKHFETADKLFFGIATDASCLSGEILGEVTNPPGKLNCLPSKCRTQNHFAFFCKLAVAIYTACNIRNIPAIGN